LNSYKITSVSCGEFHTMALSDKGLVFSWGGTYRSKQGEQKEVKDLPKPMPVEYL
jgi:alpha-tubulin suppressor-like RCC1 family protein